MWSLGVITYTILCGFHPFHKAPDMNALLESICVGKVEFVKPYWDKISQDAKNFVSGCMQVVPEKRLTPLEAMRMSWIIKLCPNAREAYYDHLREEKRKKKESATDAGPHSLCPETTETNLRGLTPPPDLYTSINLIDVVWPEKKIFDAKNQWQKAVSAIRSIHRAEDLKRKSKLLLQSPRDTWDDASSSSS